jgi:hypothetical protein
MALGISSSYEGYNFSEGAVSGQMAAGLAAGAEIFQFRWAPGAGARKARILCVQMSAAVDTTGFTAGAASFDMAVARAWTANGTGGTVVTPTSNSNKLRTSQVPSLFSAGGEIRIASTAALTAGTKTVDANPINSMVGGAGAAGSTIIFPIPLYVDWAATASPLCWITRKASLSAALCQQLASGSLASG